MKTLCVSSNCLSSKKWEIASTIGFFCMQWPAVSYEHVKCISHPQSATSIHHLQIAVVVADDGTNLSECYARSLSCSSSSLLWVWHTHTHTFYCIVRRKPCVDFNRTWLGYIPASYLTHCMYRCGLTMCLWVYRLCELRCWLHCWTPRVHVDALVLQALTVPLACTVASFPGAAQVFVVCSV